METIKVLLFGMTGMGNSAVETLSGLQSVELAGVFTPHREAGPFPYYKCEHIQDAAQRKGIPLFEGLRLRAREAQEAIARMAPDLIVVASYNQIIPREVIALPRIGVVNIHPSLLPEYRGATPTVWALINGEQETGVTAHFIESEEVDSGRIICQASLTISPDETDGALRRRLSDLSRAVIEEAVELVRQKGAQDFPTQDEALASWHPKRTERDAVLDLSRPVNEIRRRIRAMTPFPGARLQHEGRFLHVLDAVACGNDDAVEPNTIIAKTDDGVVKFTVAKEI